VIVDYLKPGTEEIADIVPAGLAARLRNWEKSRGKPFNFGLLLKTSSIAGFLSLKLLSLLKPWRRKTSRFALEQATIERWLGAVKRLGFASLDRELAMEIVQCGRIVRGYGETNRRGREALAKIFENLLENEAAGSRGIDNLKLAVRGARNAALADPDCKPAGPAPGTRAKPVIWMKTG
jgi:indolepyruvate ferredoxin oxidoreductase beta subunit